MNALPDRAVFRFGKAASPSPLLSFLAGEFADEIAALWPAPHEAFFALPTARRHATALLLLQGRETPLDPALARRVAHDKDGVLARHIAGEAAPGFMKALAKAGERLWKADGYATLLELFHEPLANQALRHMEMIRLSALAPLMALPAPLRAARTIAATPCSHAARDLAIAFDLATRMKGELGRKRFVERASRAKDRAGLFAMAVEELTPDEFRAPLPPPELAFPFSRVRSMDELVKTALEFRNCLRDFSADIANGRMAVYVWRGLPYAAVALTWDAAGWRLAEAEAADNEPLEVEPLKAIVEEVCKAGVRTGPTLRSLIGRLECHAQPGRHPEKIGTSFEDRLELGDLWI